jgi:hypothetical protein
LKFGCDRCGKRYASTDDPVRGRVYRIRCRCGHVIVLRPEGGVAPSVAATARPARAPAPPPARTAPPSVPAAPPGATPELSPEAWAEAFAAEPSDAPQEEDPFARFVPVPELQRRAIEPAPVAEAPVRVDAPTPLILFTTPEEVGSGDVVETRAGRPVEERSGEMSLELWSSAELKVGGEAGPVRRGGLRRAVLAAAAIASAVGAVVLWKGNAREGMGAATAIPSTSTPTPTPTPTSTSTSTSTSTPTPTSTPTSTSTSTPTPTSTSTSTSTSTPTPTSTSTSTPTPTPTPTPTSTSTPTAQAAAGTPPEPAAIAERPQPQPQPAAVATPTRPQPAPPATAPTAPAEPAAADSVPLPPPAAAPAPAPAPVEPPLGEAVARKADGHVAAARPIDPAEVKAVIAHARPALDACVAEALASAEGARLAGRRTGLLLLVTPTGRAEGAIEETDLDAAPVGGCLKRVAGTLSFPVFAGEPFAVRIPIVLGRSPDAG